MVNSCFFFFLSRHIILSSCRLKEEFKIKYKSHKTVLLCSVYLMTKLNCWKGLLLMMKYPWDPINYSQEGNFTNLSTNRIHVSTFKVHAKEPFYKPTKTLITTEPIGILKSCICFFLDEQLLEELIWTYIRPIHRWDFFFLPGNHRLFIIHSQVEMDVVTYYHHSHSTI